MRLILASASPRRAELLTAAGFRFEIRVADVDEAVRPGELPRDYVLRLAKEKATAVSPGKAGRHIDTAEPDVDMCVLAADTTVVVDDCILGKPVDDDDARRMLRLLSGRSHQVLTGVAVKMGADMRATVVSTSVWFDALGDDEIEWYVASREGCDKAGGYAIQGLASRFIPRIDGSYSNVVGLPVATVHQLLAEMAQLTPKQA